MKKVLNFIFIVLFVIALLGFGTLSVSRSILNNGTSNKKKSELSTSGIGATYNIKGEDKLVTYAEIENIDSVDPEIAHRYLDADLTKQGIPTDTLEYVLAEDDYQGMYYEYRAKAIGYLKGENEKPELEIDRILGMVDRGLTKYNAEKGTKLPVEDIKADTNTVAVGIDTQIEKLKSSKVVTTGLKVATSNKLYYGSLILLVISTVALFIINGIVKGLQKIGIGLILSGIGSIIVSIAVNSPILKKIQEFASTIVKYISNKTMTYGIIYIIVGIVLIVVSALLVNNKNKKVMEKGRPTREEVEKIKEDKEETPAEEEIEAEEKETKNNKKKSKK